MKDHPLENKKILSIKGENSMKRNNSTPKRKTSVYLSKDNIETIKGFKEKFDMSLNSTVNVCLSKYLPEMKVWSELKRDYNSNDTQPIWK